MNSKHSETIFKYLDSAVPGVPLSSGKDMAFCFLLHRAVKSRLQNFHTAVKILDSVAESDKNKFYASARRMNFLVSTENPESASVSEFSGDSVRYIFQHPDSRP